MKIRLTYAVYWFALLAYVVAGFRVYQLSAAGKEDDPYAQFEVLARVLEKVRKDYVEGDKLTYKDLVRGAMKGMLNSLDPHSEFMDLTEYQELKEDTEGSYGGVGLQVGIRDNALTVIAPMEDTPAFEAGILPGDRVLEIDGVATDKSSQSEVVKKLRGTAGSKVTLLISRSSFAQPREFVLTRADIRVFTAKDNNNRREFPLAENKIGYVRLTQFGERTGDELESALAKLETQGMTALVLDLRGNPGGLLDQAVEVCERFLKKGQLIVTTESRSSVNDVKRFASGQNKVRTFPMAVLVNGSSASASEIVAGCLQDLKRALVVGELTFGKGSVQSVLPLQDGSALRLTTAKYYTPSHKVIHEHGITPDISVAMTDNEEMAVQLRRIPGGLENLGEALKGFDSERQAILRDLVVNGRDSQLERATDLLKGLGLYVKQENQRSLRQGAKRPIR